MSGDGLSMTIIRAYEVTNEQIPDWWTLTGMGAYFSRRDLYARYKGETRGFLAGSFQSISVPTWAKVALWTKALILRRGVTVWGRRS